MEQDEKLRLVLTFKKEEKYLFDEVQSHSGKGNWIKDILKAHIRTPDLKDENK